MVGRLQPLLNDGEEPLTYNLSASADYYRCVEALSGEVLRHAASLFEPTIKRHLAVVEGGLAAAEQFCLELLIFGVWRQRAGVPRAEEITRQIELTLDFYKDSSDHRYQLGRLRKLQGFLIGLIGAESADLWHKLAQLTDWFAMRSREELGCFIERIAGFLASHETGPGRDDDYFCQSPHLEYYLNMVGSEILNRNLRPGFLNMKQKLVVLPGCLRANPQGCQAEPWLLGLSCTHCTPGCRVSRIANLGLKHGFTAAMVLHQTSLSSHAGDLETFNRQGGCGVLGVACVLSLLEGGYLLESRGLPAQCVPLDHSSCPNHWQGGKGPTTVNLDRLLGRVLGF